MSITQPHVESGSLLAFERLLDQEPLESLRAAIADWSLRQGGQVPSSHRGAAPFALPSELVDVLTEWINRLVPLARRHLGIDHFRMGETVLAVGVHGPDGAFHSTPATGSVARRRLDFVYHLDGVGEPPAGGRLSVARRTPNDTGPSSLSFEHADPVDNSIVFFRSDVHHRVAPTTSTRFTVWGWIAEAATAEISTSGDDAVPRSDGRLSEFGFEVRPIPVAVHQLLRSLLELRMGRIGPESADPTYHLGPDNDFVQVGDLSDDVLEALRPIHEEFAGVPLVGSAMFGLRIYRAGAVLDMHCDRAETHVVSSVLQIAQDVDRPWPIMLEVGYQTHELVLGPGQMLLYEGAVCAHGRPQPLVGRSFVNAFVHYRPRDARTPSA